MCSGAKLIFLAVTVLTLTSELGSSDRPHYDLVVIGGGSGGLAAAKDAYEKYGKKVLVVDYVKPSPQGTKWGEGGTCVNVGCIPKKLMHQASLIGEAVKEAGKYGWEIKNPDKVKLNWVKMKNAVQAHVESVNWVTNTQLTSAEVKKVTDYINGQGEFVDKNTIKVTERDLSNGLGKLSSTTHEVTADTVLIAVGGRPNYPTTEDGREVEGARKFGITSDDLFSLKEPPGKTLIIGAGYIGLECAGFLAGMGMEVTVMVRYEKVLKGFDQQMANMVKEELHSRGVKFLLNSQVVSIVEEVPPVWKFFQKRKLRIRWKTRSNEQGEDLYDTLLLAIGRHAVTADLKLENVGITADKDGKLNAENEKVLDNIYAVGDVLQGKPELTPVAIQAGKRLMARLYGGSSVLMDYDNVPTTVFTPLEYSCVGLSEEKAKTLGEDNIEVYHAKYSPTEFAIPHKDKSRCYLKVVCEKKGDQKILGMHFLGPTAGEVMQGYASAIKVGLTFKQLQETVGIHPTVAEEFTRLYITKSSGVSPEPQSCCS